VRTPRRPTVLRLGAAAASGILLALSRPPVDLGPLALFALVPLFVVWRDRRPRACAGYGFVAGVVYYAVSCSWIWYFGAVAIVPFVAATSMYWAAAGALVGWLRTRRITNPFLTAAVWVVGDAFVARTPVGGFSWGELGYSFHDLAPARAVASVGGLALVTYLAVAFNALVADLLVQRPGWKPVLRSYAGIVLILVVAAGATVKRAQPHVRGHLNVALLQGNDKNRDLTDEELDDRYLPNSHFDLAERIRDPVNLIVFPESSMDDDPRTDPFLRGRLAEFARRHNAWVLANATVDAPASGSRAAGEKAENLNVLFAPNGEIVGTYSKRHLVPFGEYVPFRNTLEGIIPALDQVPRDFVTGDGPGVFEIAGERVATVICFESAFGYQVRPLVADHDASVIVVSTNNRSYQRSANSAQHVAFGQMRAAETGRPVVQAAISGITAVIDANGVVREHTELFDRTLLETTIAATTGQTPYVRYGEWATLVCIAVVLGAVAFALIRRRRKTSVESGPHETVSVVLALEHYGEPAEKTEASVSSEDP
jgi:apolipoprotein N-acyltransferase